MERQTKPSMGISYNAERENNIIKNIAKEIVYECHQTNLYVTQELADYMVKLKLLNPLNGFTASVVMPRSLTQQLVSLIVEDLKQDNPGINCIRMQVHWNSVNLNVAELKKEYEVITTEKAEPLLVELFKLDRQDHSKFTKCLASYILVAQSLGNVSQNADLRETIAALLSCMHKYKEVTELLSFPEDQRMETIRVLAKRVTGIRLYLKATGKSGEGIRDVRELTDKIEAMKEEVAELTDKVSQRIEYIRGVVANLMSVDFFAEGVLHPAEIFLPSDCETKDLVHLKKILVIMVQHSFYLSDIISKLEEIDGDLHVWLKEYDQVLNRLNNTIRDRDSVPAFEVYDDFKQVGEIWSEIQSYAYCVEIVNNVHRKLQEMNKGEYFDQTNLEKIVNLRPKALDDESSKLGDSRSLLPSNMFVLRGSDDFHLEFRGFCAWNLFFADGLLVPGNPKLGIGQYKDQYYSFSSKFNCELWNYNPSYYLLRILENLRRNPEMIELLDAYDTLYNVKTQILLEEVDDGTMAKTQEVQTLLHPIEKHIDRNYTYSEWELKRRALQMSYLINCVTKSVQTVNHSHFRSSIGILVAPDKDKECQTKRDKGCVHSTISNYLYGLRGHKENKFKVLTLTRPPDETFVREILHEKDRNKEHKKSSKYRYYDLEVPWEIYGEGEYCGEI